LKAVYEDSQLPKGGGSREVEWDQGAGGTIDKKDAVPEGRRWGTGEKKNDGGGFYCQGTTAKAHEPRLELPKERRIKKNKENKMSENN